MSAGQPDAASVSVAHGHMRSSAGRPIPAEVRLRAEQQLGGDFADVVFHSDRHSAMAAGRLGASALTVGHDVYFAAGTYRPDTTEGSRLITHELFHTRQQRAGTHLPTAVSDPSDAAERQADAAAGTHGHRNAPMPVGQVIQRTVPTGNGIGGVTPRIEEFQSLVRQYRDLVRSGRLSNSEQQEVRVAISRAETALRSQRQTAAGGGLAQASAGALALTGVLLADDVSVIGVADDVAIPFTLIAAGVLAIGAAIAAPSPGDLARSARAAERAVADAISTIGTIVLASRVGNQIRSHAKVLAVHLARFLNETVGGQPPSHQRDPGGDKPGWWTEIKAFLKDITKHGLTPRQMLRELRKRFTDEQIRSIGDALRRVAREMGENPPNWPPAI